MNSSESQKENKFSDNCNVSSEKYDATLEWLFRQLPMFSRIGAAAYKPGLDTSLALDSHFNHPHHDFKSIHVAGTNGKGSTSHMLASILQHHGYKTGLYTSPHLVDFRERMRINGKMIPREAVVDFIDRYRNSGYNGNPSFFELTMMMAFDWFAKENVDFAVIETGMGGRLDSTNIISPELCVITNISKDHTQFLGDTLPKIALEKAGIMKKGIPVVIGEADGEIRDVFERHAESIGAPIIFSEDSTYIESISENPEGGWDGICSYGEFHSPLPGDYQIKNIQTVLHAADAMISAGIGISDKDITEGIGEVVSSTGLRGRWTIIDRHPLTIADTGHNQAGITYNMTQLNRLMKDREGAVLRIVIGFVADKDIERILKLLPDNAEYYITNAQIPRALNAVELKKRFNDAGLDGRVFKDVKTAYNTALSESSANDIIFIGGSTFIVADFLSYIDNADSK